MNRLEGVLESIRGAGAVQLATVSTAWGPLCALVLDVGSPERRYQKGQKVRILFKETTLVVAGAHHAGLEGTILSRNTGEALVDMEIELADSCRVRAVLPFEEVPPLLSVGDRIRLFIPASAVALEMI